MNSPLPASEHDVVQLGPAFYEVIPQPIPYLRRAMPVVFASLSEEEVTADNLGELLTQKPYELLSIFLPDIMPMHEWEGFRSADAMETGDFDVVTARKIAPTGPQVRSAIMVCFRANGLDIWQHIGRFVDPTMLKPLIQRAIDSISPTSLNSSLASTRPSPSTIFLDEPSPPEETSSPSPAMVTSYESPEPASAGSPSPA